MHWFAMSTVETTFRTVMYAAIFVFLGRVSCRSSSSGDSGRNGFHRAVVCTQRRSLYSTQTIDAKFSGVPRTFQKPSQERDLREGWVDRGMGAASPLPPPMVSGGAL